ncbi:MAG: hypothetical protein ACI81O_002245 [Cyclobacteriaceae bacterium]|jgi:hypothetical protein
MIQYLLAETSRLHFAERRPQLTILLTKSAGSFCQLTNLITAVTVRNHKKLFTFV